MRSLFLFTRDFRIYDNTTLNYVLSKSDEVIPVFVFNKVQINDSNKYKSDNCVQFMCESLDDLNEQLRKYNSRMFYFYGDLQKILIDFPDIDTIALNKDHTPFAVKREEMIKKICEKRKLEFYSFEDYTLTENNIKPYVKFTPFYKEAIKIKVRNPNLKIKNNFISDRKTYPKEIKNIHTFYIKNKNIAVNGGRTEALNILKHISDFDKYNTERDHLNISTTKLSAYLRFNVVSIREVYYYFKKYLHKNNELFKQLYWRDFYILLQESQNLTIQWKNDKKLFHKWCEGITGIPIIDAGMRELNETGFMHNRARMCVSTFLVKILHIDWRLGELYFAQNLVDYSYENNNGGWKWSAGINASSQAFYTCFNYYTQAKKYDKNCEYIKKWIPELKDIDNKIILNWNTEYKNHNIYIEPCVHDFTKQLNGYIKMYKHAKSKQKKY